MYVLYQTAARSPPDIFSDEKATRRYKAPHMVKVGDIIELAGHPWQITDLPDNQGIASSFTGHHFHDQNRQTFMTAMFLVGNPPILFWYRVTGNGQEDVVTPNELMELTVRSKFQEWKAVRWGKNSLHVGCVSSSEKPQVKTMSRRSPLQTHMMDGVGLYQQR